MNDTVIVLDVKEKAVMSCCTVDPVRLHRRQSVNKSGHEGSGAYDRISN